MAKECMYMYSATENKYSMINFEQDPVTKIAPWYVNIIPSYQTGFKIRQFRFLSTSISPFIMTQPQRSQQQSYYYSINISDILTDNSENSVTVSSSPPPLFTQRRHQSSTHEMLPSHNRLLWGHCTLTTIVVRINKSLNI